MASYLFTTWDGGGNLGPELAVARRLLARGHSVRVLADPTTEPEARAAGCEFSPWVTAPHRKSRSRGHDVVKDYEASSPVAAVAMMIDEFLAKPARRFIDDTLTVLDRHGADAIVTDFAVVAPLIAAEARGLKSAILVPNIWIYPTEGIPPMGPGFMPAQGPLGRLRDTAMRAFTRRMFSKGLPHFNEARNGLGLPPVASTHDQLQRADRMIVLTSPKFDFLSPAMPSHVRYAGPELGDPDWVEPWRSPWKDDDARPLVVASLSSTFQDQIATLSRIIEALASLDVRAIVTLGPAVSLDEVPRAENVVVVPSAPHGQLFPKAALAISHCGHGTTMKALTAGTPLVCMPMGRDQNDTAARVVHAGAGLRLKPTASARAIATAVKTILGDAGFRERARALGAAIEQREGCVDAAVELEDLAGPPARRQRRERDAAEAAKGPPALEFRGL